MKSNMMKTQYRRSVVSVGSVCSSWQQRFSSSSSSQTVQRPDSSKPHESKDVIHGGSKKQADSLQRSVDKDNSIFRGISARSGVSVALWHNFKPDPFLRHQMTFENQRDILEATLVPLLKLNYEEQLLFKHQRMKKLIKNLSVTLSRRIQNIHLDENDCICPIDPVVPSVNIHFEFSWYFCKIFQILTGLFFPADFDSA